LNSEIKIKVVGTQVDEYGEENKIELVTEAKYYKKANASYIVYEESELSGMENSTTRLKIQKDRVQMKRYGSTSSDMVFDEAESHRLDYHTPFGIFKMEIETVELEVSLNEALKGSKIEIDYTLTMAENGVKTKNTLFIEVI
jgi:uncharacterized beta-barrel protein YwiB (DUF1934 family)